MNGKMNCLLERALFHYDEFKNRGFIVKDSYPILYFGNYNEYCKSEIRIITVGLNPSWREFFKDNKKDNKRERVYKRFPDIKSNELSSYFDAYDNYFEKDKEKEPLDWFNSNEKILNGMKCSYYNDGKFPYRALHTDICSPLATDPTWSNLKAFKQELMKDGVEIWHDLVRILKPDIVICSFAEWIRKKIQFNEGKHKWEDFYPIINKDGTEKKPKHIVTKAKIKIGEKDSYIFWGNQKKGGPFSPNSHPERKKIGESIYDYFTKI